MRETLRTITALYVLTYYRKHLGIKSEPHKLLMRTLSLSDVTAKRLIAVLYNKGYIDFTCSRDLEDVKEKIRELYRRFRAGPYIGFQLAKIISEILEDKECSLNWDVTSRGQEILRDKLSKGGLSYNDLIRKPLGEALKNISAVFKRKKTGSLDTSMLTWIANSSSNVNMSEIIDNIKRQAPEPPIVIQSAPAKVVIFDTLHEGIEVIGELVDEGQIRLNIGAGLEFMADREKATLSIGLRQKVSIKYKKKTSRLSLYGFLGQHLFSPLVTGFKAYTTLYPVFTKGRIAESEIIEFVWRWYWPRVTKPKQVLDAYDGVYVRRELTKRGAVYEALISDEVRTSFSSVIGYFNRMIYNEVHRALAVLGLTSTTPKRTVDVINASKAFGTSLISVLWRDLHYAPFPALTGNPEEDYKELTSYSEFWIARVLDKMPRSHALLMLDKDVYGSLAWTLKLLGSANIVRTVGNREGTYILPYSLYQRLTPLENYIGHRGVGDIISALAMLIKSKSKKHLPTEYEVLASFKRVLGDKDRAEAYLHELYRHNILFKVYFNKTGFVLTPFDVPGLLLELSDKPLLSLLVNDSILPHIHYKLLALTRTSAYKEEFLNLFKTVLERGKVDLVDYAKIALIPEGAAVIELLKDLGLEHEGTKLIIKGENNEELQVILAMLIEAIEWSAGDIDEDKVKYVRRTNIKEIDKVALETLRRTKSIQDQLEASSGNAWIAR